MDAHIPLWNKGLLPPVAGSVACRWAQLSVPFRDDLRRRESPRLGPCPLPGAPHIMDRLMHVGSCRIHCSLPWSPPGSSVSPSAQPCWCSFPVTGAVPRALPKLTSCVLTPILESASQETQSEIFIQNCKSPLDKCNSTKFLEQVATNCSLVTRKSLLFCSSQDLPQCWWGSVANHDNSNNAGVKSYPPHIICGREGSQGSCCSQSWPRDFDLEEGSETQGSFWGRAEYMGQGQSRGNLNAWS